MIYALFFGVVTTLVVMLVVRINSGFLIWDHVMVAYWVGVLLLMTGVGYTTQLV